MRPLPQRLLLLSIVASVGCASRTALQSDPAPPPGLSVGPSVGPTLDALTATLATAPRQSGGTAAVNGAGGAPKPEKGEPWRLQAALGLPSWLAVSGSQRTRFENLDGEFRGGRGGSNQSWAFQTRVDVTARKDAWRAGVEVIDSRLHDQPLDETPDTTNVNALELLQGYIAYTEKSAFADGDSLDILAGRHTMDVGSRRLVARNAFRNTINSFTGLNAVWKGAQKEQVRAFVVSPVNRLPSDAEGLRDNDVEFDEELRQTRLFGVHAERPILGDGRTIGELYVIRLDEDDEEDVNTRNRDLWTAGARILRRPAKGKLHFEWESMYQTGDSRSNTNPANTTDLDHRAHYHHLMLGYQFADEHRTRIEGLFDYASGDRDSTDGEQNRFDTIFGARRWEYGPTGIFGPFARANMLSPGLRLTLSPFERTQVMLTHRLHYRASTADAWTVAGLNDPDGARFIGHFTEGRVIYDVVPESLQFELGVAFLQGGGLIEDTASADWDGDSAYVYVGTNFSF